MKLFEMAGDPYFVVAANEVLRIKAVEEDFSYLALSQFSGSFTMRAEGLPLNHVNYKRSRELGIPHILYKNLEPNVGPVLFTDQIPLLTRVLPAGFTVEHSTFSELQAYLTLQRPDFAVLPARFTSTLEETSALLAALTVRNRGTTELLSQFTARYGSTASVKAGLSIRRSASQDLPAKLRYLPRERDRLFARFSVAQFPDPQDLPCIFEVGQDSKRLTAKFYVRFYSEGLLGGVYIRPESARATDFVLEDTTRVLTVGGASRELSDEGKRKFRIK